MATIKETIKKLTAERDVTAEQLAKCFQEIMTAEASPAQVGAFLVLLKSHYISPQVLHECSQVLLGYAMRCHVESNEPVLDIVGTGGDSSSIDTFNVSTAAAIVCAAVGLKVAKHGNRSNSGKCGSADFVEALGANIAADCTVAQEALNKTGFSFLFSQKFHPTMKSVAQIRRELGVRTIFNILGPLVNPARPAYIVAGVGTKELGPQYAKTLALNNDLKRGIVIHSSLGVDELCTQGETHVWVVENGQVEEKSWSPKDFGLQEHPIESCAGSTAPENAEMFRRILRGEEKGALLDFLLMNCAAALWLCKKVTSLVEGVDVARKTIEEGKVAALLGQYINITNSCSN